jgi:hypothetical protein
MALSSNLLLGKSTPVGKQNSKDTKRFKNDICYKMRDVFRDGSRISS